MVSEVKYNKYNAIFESAANTNYGSSKSSNVKTTQLSNDYTKVEKDESRVQYKITSNAGQVNEAEQYIDEAEKNKKNLKEIISGLISKCDEQIPQMQELEKELESYGAEITKTADENGKITSKAQSKVDEIQAKMEEQAKQINEKKSQILENNIDILCGKDKETKSKENEKLKAEIEDISSKYKSNGSDIENIITSSRTAIGNNEESVKNIADKSSEALTKAIDTNEYAQKAIDKGYEAVTLKNDYDTMHNNGYNVWEWISGKNVTQGSEAIVEGSKLGEASATIANQVKSIGSKYDFAIDSGSGIDELANKSYQDTSEVGAIDEALNSNETRWWEKGSLKKDKIAANKKVADKVVAERKKAEEEAKKAQ